MIIRWSLFIYLFLLLNFLNGLGKGFYFFQQFYKQAIFFLFVVDF